MCSIYSYHTETQNRAILHMVVSISLNRKIINIDILVEWPQTFTSFESLNRGELESSVNRLFCSAHIHTSFHRHGLGALTFSSCCIHSFSYDETGMAERLCSEQKH